MDWKKNENLCRAGYLSYSVTALPDFTDFTDFLYFEVEMLALNMKDFSPLLLNFVISPM